MTTRREFLAGSLPAIAVAALAACAPRRGRPNDARGSPRLQAAPAFPRSEASVGETPLGLSPSSRDGLLYVPAIYRPETPLPLLVALHGAGGRADNWRSFYGAAEDRGLILAVPESRGRTWDRVNASYGPDVAFLDRALAHVFERCHVDPSRLALVGFSDGASYALSLGLANGDLFSHVIAFSPGFADIGSAAAGMPRVFISHGVSDTVLPVRLSRDGVVPLLRRAGYHVHYEEFEGGHEVPAEVGAAALDWLTA